MVKLLLLLLGESFAERHLSKIALFGAFWCVAGAFLFIDALDNVLWFPLRAFGVLLLLEGAATLVLARTGLSLKTHFRYARGLLFVVIGLLVISNHRYSEFFLAMLFGVAFALEGALQIASAWMVRFDGWRQTMWGGVLSLLIAVFFLEPYPTYYHGTVPYCVGVWLFMGGARALWLYARTRAFTGHALLQVVEEGQPTVATDADASRHTWRRSRREMFARKLRRGKFHGKFQGKRRAGAQARPAAPMVVHVWTPVGSSKHAAVRRPLIDRYVAAVDVNGVISTGHAALEAGPTYLSLYPGAEIDRSPDEFARLLRADASNDIPGRYLPSYPEEAASWCESTTKITFHRYDADALNRFWSVYRQTPVYNLTSRNCSSTVALGLEAALTGSLAKDADWKGVLRLVTTPELWVAAQLRHRAHTMAWTPGLVLDYARALRVLTHPPKLGWITLAALAFRRSSRVRRLSK